MSTLLELVDLSVSIAGKSVCHSLSLTIKTGQCWGVLGANGIGKTTLLHTLGGLRTADAGTVLLDGVPLSAQPRRRIAQRIGLLFQDSSDAFPATVLDTVLIGRHPHVPNWAWESVEDIHAARCALTDSGLDGMELRMVDSLSGGERRRVALAALLAQDPALYLLDEPVNHLDLHQQIATLDLLIRRARANDKALLMVVHDVNLAMRFCDHALLLFGDGAVAHGETMTVLTTGQLQRLYRHPVVRIQDPQGTAFLPG